MECCHQNLHSAKDMSDSSFHVCQYWSLIELPMGGKHMRIQYLTMISVNKTESPMTDVYKNWPKTFTVCFGQEIYVLSSRKRMATIGWIYYWIIVNTSWNQWQLFLHTVFITIESVYVLMYFVSIWFCMCLSFLFWGWTSHKVTLKPLFFMWW